MSEENEELQLGIVKGVTSILQEQITRAPELNRFQMKKRMQGSACLGYIFGFGCAALEKYDIVEQQEKFDALEKIYSKIFNNEGTRFLREAIRLHEYEDFHQWRNLGWKEFEMVIEEVTPTGLTKILEKDPLEAEKP